tara:strand:- start:8 stop:1009 length:1002 start_codon:yes stop_codon:yes gene_type:complete
MPGVRMGAGPPTGQYYVSLMGERGMSPDGWHWGTLHGRVPETVKIKGPLVPGQRVQFKRLHKDTSIQWAIFRSQRRMPQHGTSMPGPGLAWGPGYPGVRVIVPPVPVPNPVEFQPSEYSDYGWISAFPLAALTVSASAARRGLSNQPATAAHQANLSLVSDFLGKLPFSLRLNSAYRSPPVNEAVGGSRTSQHMNGLAVDATPQGISNKDAAAWLFDNRAKFPELDQVIWYNDTSHIHIGICPPGASGCPRRSGARGEFLRATKEGGIYFPWAPTAEDTAKMAALYAYHRPAQVGLLWLGSMAAAAFTLGLLYLIEKKVKRKRSKIQGVEDRR